MKSIKLICALFLCAILIQACEVGPNEEAVIETDQLSIPEDLSGVNFGGLILPEGSKSIISTDKSTLNVRLSEKFVYIASENGNLLIADEGGYTCTSKCSDGCDVYKFGNDIGCKSCPKDSSEKCVGQSTRSSFHTIGAGKGGGFIDLTQGVSFVKPGEEAQNSHTLPDWEVMMMHPEVQKSLTKFVDAIWPDGEIAYKRADKALVNVYGIYIRLYVPENLREKYTSLSVVAGEEVSCKCDSGEGGCKHEDVIVGKGILSKKIGDKCVAGACTTCTMTW